jgi:hypothetical protein
MGIDSIRCNADGGRKIPLIAREMQIEFVITELGAAGQTFNVQLSKQAGRAFLFN